MNNYINIAKFNFVNLFIVTVSISILLITLLNSSYAGTIKKIKEPIYERYYFFGQALAYKYFKNKNFKKALYYNEKDYLLAKKFKNHRLELISLVDIVADYNFTKNENLKNELYWNKELIKNLNTNKLKSEFKFYYFNVASIYFMLHRYRNAAQYYKKSLPLYKNANNFYYVGAIYTNLGEDYMKLKDFYNASRYSMKSIKIELRQNKYSLYAAVDYLNLSSIYQENNNKYFSIYYLEKAYKIYKKNKLYTAMKTIKSELNKLKNQS